MKSVKRSPHAIVRWLTGALGVAVRNRRMRYLQAELSPWILSAASELPSLHSDCNTACKYIKNLWGSPVSYSLKISTFITQVEHIFSINNNVSHKTMTKCRNVLKFILYHFDECIFINISLLKLNIWKQSLRIMCKNDTWSIHYIV